MTAAVALAASLPWVLAPFVIVWRARNSRSLDDWSDVVPAPVPRVSVVIPARNEARNIERCLRSVLGSKHPDLEVIVVDDHSTDETGGLARAIALDDARVRVIMPDPLPDGWFGKQWACTAGAAVATGEILLFTDADTVHAPDLMARSVNAMRARGADLFSVAGRQELGTFWERAVQPQMFGILVARYGSTERVSNATRPEDAIANGQCIFITRAAYDASGGHAAVRDKVAEDLALAQRFVRQGRRLALVAGLDQLGTRMYTSLDEIVRGWRKNVYVGGRDAMPSGPLMRALFPMALLAAPLFSLAPVVAFLAGLAGLASPHVFLWAAVCVLVTLGFWMAAYAFQRLPVWYAAGYPLGAAVVLYIAVAALVRGPRVDWKGRSYTAR
ncbi:MAG TPA: glycosyltransferase family 2 protein [Gemmatimonadaceae bacterium]